jgi:cyclase
MLKKRIAGSILIQNNYAVQSFGYTDFLPLGKPSELVENLARWRADEIVITDISAARNNNGINYDMIGNLADHSNGTPLIYGGGIRSKTDAITVINSGADRVVVETSILTRLLDPTDLVQEIGAQAIILSLPLIKRGNEVFVYSYIDSSETPLIHYREFIEGSNISEILVIDVVNEGSFTSHFDLTLIDNPLFKKSSLICKGGVNSSDICIQLLGNSRVSSVMLGNVLNLSELSYVKIKDEVNVAIPGVVRRYDEM